jgi:hypothetical protein
MPPNKNITPTKQLEESFVTFDESEYMSFRLSRIEGLVKRLVSKGKLEQSINKLRGYLENNMQGSVKIGYLSNLQTQIEENGMNIEERMGHVEDNIGRIVKLLHHQDGKIPKEEELDQGTHEEKNSVGVELPSMNKHDIRGIDSNMGSNQGWSPRGLQLPKIDMRKFDGKDPITWIF